MSFFIVLALSLYSYYLMKRALKKTPHTDDFTKSERIQVILLLILNTLISWAIFHFGWSKQLPAKSKRVDAYLRNIMITLMIIAAVGVLLSFVLVAINPAAQMRRSGL